MKIHLISYLFAPDSLGGAALYTDLARFLQERGHDVKITSTFSFYPQYRYSSKDSKLSSRDEKFEGMDLRRIAMRLPANYRGWRRLIPELSFLVALRKRGRFANWTPDVVLVGCPMLAQPLAARGLYGPGTPLVVVVQDLMADAAANLGIIRMRGVLKVLQAVERRALRKASQLVTISEDMKSRLVELTARIVDVIPNWVHGSLQTQIDQTRAEGWPREPATLFYSGNLGVKQGLPDFIPDFLEASDEWSLRVHGAGPEAEQLRSNEAHLRFHLGPLLNESDYVRALYTATACLITQRSGTGQSFLPSKLLPALATCTPVLAICDSDSPLGREISAHGTGVVVKPGDRHALRKVLSAWRNHGRELVALSERAGERAKAFSRDKTLSQYEALLMTQAPNR